MLIENNVLIKADDDRIVEIPQGVERIGEKAFFFATNVKKIIIPTTVKEFDKNAMYCCLFIRSVKYQGTIEQWKEIKFNGIFSSPLYYAKKFEFTNWRKCLPNRNATYYSLTPRKTDEDIMLEKNDYDLFQKILLYYEDLSTNYGKKLENLYSGNIQNPKLDENSLTQTAKFFELDKWYVSKIVTYFIKSNQLHYLELVNFRQLLKNNQSGVVSFDYLDKSYSWANKIEVENGKVTIVFINPDELNFVEDTMFLVENDSKEFNSLISKFLDCQIQKVCEHFGIRDDFNVRIENWITLHWSKGIRHAYTMKNYKTNQNKELIK